MVLKVKNLLKVKYLKKKFIYSLLIIFLVFLLKIIPKEIPYFDKKGEEYFNNAIQETIAIYGVVRITNALVSVAKETEIEITPVGVGITLHIGQFLDPLDDATERLSTILTISLAILGLMKIFKEILTVYTFKLISYILILFLPIIWIEKLKNYYLPILTTIILILGLRFALPVCGIVNNYLYINFFQPKLEENKKVFTELKNLSNEEIIDSFVLQNTNDNGLFSKFKNIGNRKYR